MKQMKKIGYNKRTQVEENKRFVKCDVCKNMIEIDQYGLIRNTTPFGGWIK